MYGSDPIALKKVKRDPAMLLVATETLVIK